MNKEVYFQKSLLKRLSIQSGWYDCKDLTEILNEAFSIGIQYTMEWRNFYLEQPDNESKIILKINESQYHICIYLNKKCIDITTKLPVELTNSVYWRLLE